MDVTAQIKGLCFDKDGTLFDFAATWEVWAATFIARVAQGDSAEPEQIAAAIGFDLARQRFSRDSIVIAGTAQEVARALFPVLSDLSSAQVLDMIDEEATRAPQVPAVPLVPLLSDLRDRGLRLGVATNDSAGPTRAHLASAGITRFFDFIAGYDSGYGGKPAPGQLLAFAQAIGAAPSQVVMVGDSTHDLNAGRAAGMRTVAVLTGAATAEELSPLANTVLADIGEIPAWLDALAIG
nr:HAD family hydrolase [uncultured Sulfitobacter sp.]